jgi:hypothetical protein
VKINSAMTATLAHAHQSPAKAARELLANRPDLADKPFGQIVSKIARGEEIVAPPPSEPTESVHPDSETVQLSEDVNIVA